MLLINTRPQDRAAALTQALQMAGYQVDELPLLELIAAPFSKSLEQLYQQLDQVQVIVVVSPTAVEIGMRYLKQAKIALERLKHIQWIAVGQTTAQALHAFGIRSVVPKVENSEGMLALPQLAQATHLNNVAFWRGIGGRQFMMHQLQQQGIDVLNFVLYHRQCPELSIERFSTLVQQYQQQYQYVAVVISSEASWNNWQGLLQHNPTNIQWVYLVLGQRLTQLLETAQAQSDNKMHIISLDYLSAKEMVTCLDEWQQGI